MMNISEKSNVRVSSLCMYDKMCACTIITYI